MIAAFGLALMLLLPFAGPGGTVECGSFNVALDTTFPSERVARIAWEQHGGDDAMSCRGMG